MRVVQGERKAIVNLLTTAFNEGGDTHVILIENLYARKGTLDGNVVYGGKQDEPGGEGDQRSRYGKNWLSSRKRRGGVEKIGEVGKKVTRRTTSS